MTNVELLLSGNYTLEELKLALSDAVNQYDKIFTLLTNSNDIKNNLLGVTLNKVFTNNIDGYLKQTSGDLLGIEYELQSDVFKIKCDNLVSDDTSIKKYLDFYNFLEANFLKKNKTWDAAQEKNNFNTNALSVREIKQQEKINTLSKATESLTVNSGTVSYVSFESNSILNVKAFKTVFYNKDEVLDYLFLTFNNIDGLFLSNSSFKEIKLNLTDSEITGSGCKISDFVETQAAQSAQSAIVEIYVKYLFPGQSNTLNVNGADYSYTPTTDDTPDIVADTLGGNIAGGIDGVSYTTEAGYYSAAPQDDDNEIKLAWYYPTTETGLDVNVSLTEDNSSEHDLEVNWDADNHTLEVVYASDGSDTMYPTIGDILDGVNNSDSPIKVELVNSSYTTDDDYPYEMDFTLDQTDSKIILTSTKTDLTVTGAPTDLFDINKTQSYVDGKHQTGNVEVVKFRRGYVYYIKIDDTQYTVDTTNENNPDINTEVALASKFVELINADTLSTATNSSSKILLTLKDYSEHTISTSGEQDYVEPVSRNVLVKYDVRNYAFQGASLKLFKPQNSVNSSNSPISLKESDDIMQTGVIFTPKAISDVRLKSDEDNYKYNSIDDNDVSTLYECVDEIKNLTLVNKNLLLQKKLKYISIYDSVVDADFYFQNTSMVEKYGIFTAPKNQFIPSVQLNYFNEISLDDIQKVFLGMSDTYFSTMQNTLSNYMQEENVYTPHDLLTKQNINIIGSYAFKETDLKEVFKPFYGMLNIKEFNFKNYGKVTLNDLSRNPELIKLFKNDTLIDDSGNETQIDEYVLKHALMDLFLAQNAPNMLEQITDLLEVFFFDLNDVIVHLHSDTFRNVVLELDTPESAPAMDYGLDGTPEEAVVTFSTLYIRQYKTEINKTSDLDLDKLTTQEYKNMSTNEKALALRILPSAINATLKETLNGDNISRAVVLPLSTSNVKLIETLSIYDDMLLIDIVRNGYFATIGGFLSNRCTSGVSLKYKDTVWNALIKTFFIKDKDNIIGVQDSVSQIKILYDRFNGADPWDFAALLGPTRNIYSSESALMNLFVRIYESIKRNGIASSDYESYFNGCVGTVFMNDDTMTDILPYELFHIFLCGIGAMNDIAEGDVTDIDLSKFDFKANIEQAAAGINCDIIISETDLKLTYNDKNNLILINYTKES